MRHAFCRAAVAAAIAVSATVVTPVTAAAAVPSCTVFGASPTFDGDGSAFCAAIVIGEWQSFGRVAVYRTSDRGHSWNPVAAAGLDRLPAGGWNEYVLQIVVSPRFRTDRAVAIQLQQGGLYLSRDAGASFTLVEPAASGPLFSDDPPNVTAWEENGAATFAVAGPVPRRHSPAGIAPGMGAVPHKVEALAFAGTPWRGAVRQRLLLARTTSHGLESAFDVRYTTHVYGCTPDLTCADLRRTLPDVEPHRIWVGPDGSVYLAVGVPQNGHAGFRIPRLVRSRDGGRTFAPIASVDAIVKQVLTPRTSCFEATAPELGFAVVPGRLYLRVSGWTEGVGGTGNFVCPVPRSPPADPGDQVFESRDDGRSWRQVAWGLGPTQPGTRGTLPWRQRVGPRRVLGGIVAAGGRLFAVASDGGYTGPFCSADAGRTWRRTCPR